MTRRLVVTVLGLPGAALLVQACHSWRPIELWYPRRSFVLSSSWTDAGGNYTLRLPAGEPLTVFLKPGGEAWIESPVVTLPRDERTRFDMALGAAKLAGTVMDKATSEPMAGVLIEVFGAGGTGRSYGAVAGARRGGTTSAGDGRFEVPFLPAGTYSITASASGFAVARIDGVRVEARDDDGDVRFELDRGLPFWLHVADRGGYPVDGAKVILRGANRQLVSLRPDPGHVAPGSYEATVVHPSFASARVAFQVPGEIWEKGVTLTPGADLRVLVLDSVGRPVGGAEIALRNDRDEDLADDLMPLDPLLVTPLRGIVTESDGTAGWKHIPPGSYTVTARKGQLRFEIQPIALEKGTGLEVKLRTRR